MQARADVLARADHRVQAEEKAVQLETATDSPDEDSVGMITVMGKEEVLTVRAAAVPPETVPLLLRKEALSNAAA